jgi:hypothetical protein
MIWKDERQEEREKAQNPISGADLCLISGNQLIIAARHNNRVYWRNVGFIIE